MISSMQKIIDAVSVRTDAAGYDLPFPSRDHTHRSDARQRRAPKFDKRIAISRCMYYNNTKLPIVQADFVFCLFSCNFSGGFYAW